MSTRISLKTFHLFLFDGSLTFLVCILIFSLNSSNETWMEGNQIVQLKYSSQLRMSNVANWVKFMITTNTSLCFLLTPIVMISDSSRCNLLLNSQKNLCRSIPAGAENPSLSRLCYQKLWESRNGIALILEGAHYLNALSSYMLRTWLPSIYRGHDTWYIRGGTFPVLLY